MNKSITMKTALAALACTACKRAKTVPRTGKNETGNV